MGDWTCRKCGYARWYSIDGGWACIKGGRCEPPLDDYPWKEAPANKPCAMERLADGRMGCRSCDTSWDFGADIVCPLPDMIHVQSPAELLDAGAATFRERNAIYGDNYKRMGTLMLALFPDSVIPQVSTPSDANRLNLIIDCLGKLQRYAHNFHAGGHRDSAHDLMVYAAMLQEATK